MANSWFPLSRKIIALFCIYSYFSPERSLASAVSGLVYTPSDAYQESLLHPFRSYSDVAIFHFSVPGQTVRAMWQFVAFMDDPICPSRPVHIYLRHGSYPVVSPENYSFPEELVLPQEHSYFLETTTSFQPREMPEFHLLNPLPGSWFGVAFTPDFDSHIHVQGMGHKCRYSLGSMAAWTVQPSVQLLNPGTATQVTASVSQLNYFKFYVPEEAWQVELTLSDCMASNSSGLNGTNDEPSDNDAVTSVDLQPCLRELGLRPHALPFSEPLPLSAGINGSLLLYSHTIDRPQLNAYYYLLVVSDLRASFTLQLKMEVCTGTPIWPQALTSTGGSKQRGPRRVPLNSSNGSIYGSNQGGSPYVEVESMGSQQQKEEEQAFAARRKRSLGEAGRDICLPIIPLTRVKHAQDFLDSFLLQGHDWFSSWLAVTDMQPALVKFELLPFVDIGGTLQVKAHLDSMLQNLTTQVVSVHVCIQHGASPISAASEFPRNDLCPLDLWLWSNSSSRPVAVKYFPFPRPGLWFLSFQVACYNHSGSEWSSPCFLEQVMVDLSVRLQPCLFEGQPCGQHGFCRENHFRQFYFSSCQCTNGWGGWGCTDSRDAFSPSLQLAKTLLLTLSNLFFVPAIALAIRRRFYTEAIVYTLTMLFSTFYHACDVDMFGFCLLRYDVLQFCDFYSAILSFWVTLVGMACLGPSLTSAAHMTGALGIALGVQCQRTDLWVFLVPLLIGGVILLASWGWRLCRGRCVCSPRPWWLLRLICGAGLAGAGLSLFAFVETEANYKYVHSSWHALIALSIAFLLPPQRQDRDHSATQRHKSAADIGSPVFQVPITNEAELMDIAEYRLNSDLRSLLSCVR